jgi:hypothetical protein
MLGMSKVERPLIYGISGRSRWLMEASLVIWNVVGLMAMVALAQRLRQSGRTSGSAVSPADGDRTGRRIAVDVSGTTQRTHAREVTGDMTNEAILARELALSPRHEVGGSDPTSEDILTAELARTQAQHGQEPSPPPQ